MENCFPGWKGPTHHDVSPPWWWVTWLEFAHKPETKIITLAMLELMENEVPGPRIPGPVPSSPSYFRFTSNKTTLNCVKNYSRELLHRLVPNPQVIQQGNALQTTITEEGFTQESYIIGTLLRTTITEEELTQESHDDEEEDNLFASSLLVEDSSSIAMAWARDILKPQINKVLQCLDTPKSQSRIEQARKLLHNCANELHLELGRLSRPKRNIENCLTVNLNIKENLSKKSRSYTSKNC
jgi:hypothetical protein